MEKKWKVLGPEGLGFFGTITASTSHELKNALAVINENSGLLEDYMLMADDGMEVDPEKLSRISSRISTQVARADDIVSRLSTFAHSVDHILQEIEVGQFLQLAVALSLRILAANNVDAVAATGLKDVRIKTSPFLFLHLVSNSLIACGAASSARNTLQLSCREGSKKKSEVTISLEGFQKVLTDFPGPAEDALLIALDAKMRVEPDRGRLEIILPWLN
ncbi:MAG TPA: hypothetical protein ENK96_05915 [Desulfobulbaceae bacterium]|nr:hypothetical protein [Desulfobulbaceae bacterium]